ncbi:alpha-ketoglutarate-dependent dioxygenase AlkB [Pseudorhodoferax soli]|uniref:Alkylated DNA repair dioxygenase AlkB n=1 Tax=Pseudorhodoferax soli TaxID=545864 RepID=A0A368XAX1_9BURK|nr:alpha-ketoglutarate-dependent dioxygenase AlkB [Pseudorhodoferax soli]RCW65112.1 alkylated DNA repair dioxygenase AlkB [Pseudorhodoferax soli]
MQSDLFATEEIVAIPGLRYEKDFLTHEEEAALLDLMSTLQLQPAKYKEYLARRQVISYGGSYDFDTHRLRPAKDLDERLAPLRDRVADWLAVDRRQIVQVLVAEYAPGTPLGWHRDVPDFEIIAGVSLGSEVTLRFRPYPPDQAAKRQAVQLEVAPRSIYKMAGASRWAWQHCVAPVKSLRWSITFRTPRETARQTVRQTTLHRPANAVGSRGPAAYSP